jgi:methyl-accepting chemotaxis protein
MQRPAPRRRLSRARGLAAIAREVETFPRRQHRDSPFPILPIRPIAEGPAADAREIDSIACEINPISYEFDSISQEIGVIAQEIELETHAAGSNSSAIKAITHEITAIARVIKAAAQEINSISREIASASSKIEEET